MQTAFAALIFVMAVASASAQSIPASAVPPAPADVAAPPPDAAKTASGLAHRVVSPGTDTEKPAPTDIVTLHYTGWSADGTMFESSRTSGAPAMFALNRAMVGMRECVQLMAVGETRRCWVPQELAYRGQQGRPTGTVVFDIELLDTRRAPAVPPPDVAGPPDDARREPSGLAYKVLKPGTGTRKPSASSHVTVHYTGWTTDGKMFDSSVARGTPATFGLGDVIRGWTEGVQLMVEGERTRFWIPQDLAYKGEGNAPRGMLVFDIDLIRIER